MIVKSPRTALATYLGISPPVVGTTSLFPSVNLTRMGILYGVAAFFQLSWLILIVKNWNAAKQWMHIPIIGWVFVLLWISMLWCVPHLFYIGTQMVRLSRSPKAIVMQTPSERKRMMNTAMLLALGIMIDAVLFPLLFGIRDKSEIILLSGMMGGRVLQANSEGIFQYHGM